MKARIFTGCWQILHPSGQFCDPIYSDSFCFDTLWPSPTFPCSKQWEVLRWWQIYPPIYIHFLHMFHRRWCYCLVSVELCLNIPTAEKQGNLIGTCLEQEAEGAPKTAFLIQCPHRRDYLVFCDCTVRQCSLQTHFVRGFLCVIGGIEIFLQECNIRKYFMLSKARHF